MKYDLITEKAEINSKWIVRLRCKALEHSENYQPIQTSNFHTLENIMKLFRFDIDKEENEDFGRLIDKKESFESKQKNWINVFEVKRSHRLL